MSESRAWAESEFGRADLSDVRRTRRLVAMGAAACERPCGTVAAVFTTDREREAAYDFLENPHVDPQEILASVAAATVERCREAPFVFVPVDGTSITVTDKTGERDFGNVGSDAQGARGLKIVGSMAVDPDGVVVGWLALTFWARSPERKVPARNSHARQARPVTEKETQHWIDTTKRAGACLDEHRLRGWFQIDREGDGGDMLMTLRDTQHWWTVRGNQDRSIEIEGGTKDMLRRQLEHRPTVDAYQLQVLARPGRAARTARMIVRVAQVTLRLRDRQTGRITRFPVNVVWAREEGSAPPGEEPLDWLLFTNHNIDTIEDAHLVIYGYSLRWRIEEVHRTWKRGQCNVEATQLQSFAAVQRWAIVLGVVATRLERLKRLARENPDSPASIELTPIEIRALKMLKFGTDGDPRAPAIAEAVAWIAELGGWTHKYSRKVPKPPGATVLGRGLERVRMAAHALTLSRCER